MIDSHQFWHCACRLVAWWGSPCSPWRGTANAAVPARQLQRDVPLAGRCGAGWDLCAPAPARDRRAGQSGGAPARGGGSPDGDGDPAHAQAEADGRVLGGHLSDTGEAGARVVLVSRSRRRAASAGTATTAAPRTRARAARGRTTRVRGDAFQLTVYDREFTTPAWLQGATVYEIFPDRFRNGDPSNDYCRADVPGLLRRHTRDPAPDVERGGGGFARDRRLQPRLLRRRPRRA